MYRYQVGVLLKNKFYGNTLFKITDIKSTANSFSLYYHVTEISDGKLFSSGWFDATQLVSSFKLYVSPTKIWNDLNV